MTVHYLSNEVLDSSFVFSLLRDPVERLLSQYSYYRSLGVHHDLHTEYAQRLDLKDLLKLHGDPAKFACSQFVEKKAQARWPSQRHSGFG